MTDDIDIDDANSIFDEVCQQHALTARADRALARSLAIELASDRPDPRIVSELRAALPALAGGPSGYDLAKLDTEEFTLLHALLAKCKPAGEYIEGAGGSSWPALRKLSALRAQMRMLTEVNEHLRRALRLAGLDVMVAGPADVCWSVSERLARIRRARGAQTSRE